MIWPMYPVITSNPSSLEGDGCEVTSDDFAHMTLAVFWFGALHPCQINESEATNTFLLTSTPLSPLL